MAVNRGKDFEHQIRESFKRVTNTSVYRLQDSMGGYSGVCNICDFIIYKYPNQLFIECKSCYGNTLSFHNITKNQWLGLLDMSRIHGVIAGIIVWFIDWDKTYFVPIKTLVTLKEQGSKSLNIKMMLGNNMAEVHEILGKKKRILFDYDMQTFFREVIGRV